MRFWLAWGVAFLNAGHYILFKLRLLSPPVFRNYPTLWEPWLGGIFGWRRTLRLRFAEHCPPTGPAVFVANHVKLDDPLFLWGAVDRATAGKLHLYFMMRDDFFRGWPWDHLPFSMNEITASAGCIQISRDQISLAQLKPLLEVLKSHESFLMFPGRTRSRSGLCIEYREGIDEPGGVSFFLAHGGRRAGLPIPAVPMGRTHNPVTGISTVAFGAPRILDTGAGREAQRDFDLDLAVAVSNCTEVNALHVVCLLLYLRCLHGRVDELRLPDLIDSTAAALIAVHGEVLMDTAALESTDEAVRASVQWLARAKALQLLGQIIVPNTAAILSAPDWDTRYRKHNPVKFYCNQVLHYLPLTAAAEAQVLQTQARVAP